MKNNKVLVWLMICIMVVQVVPIQLFANGQSPVTSLQLSNDGITHTKDQNVQGKISPSVSLVWEKPPIAPPASDNNGNMGKTHDTSHYQIELYDYGNGRTHLSSFIDAKGDTMSQKIQEIGFGYNRLNVFQGEHYAIENGSFYRGRVIPKHYHSIQTGDSVIADIAPEAPGSPAATYFITDFDTKLSDAKEGLELEWEYIPGAEYTVFYVPADKKTKGEIAPDQVIAGDIPASRIVLTDDMVQEYLVEGKSRTKVRYLIKDVKPKQIYSMFVEVSGFDNDPSGQGLDRIIKNTYTDQRGPKVVQGIPGIDIDVYNVGKDEIEIYWGPIAWAEIGGELTGIKVYAREEGGQQHLVAEKVASNAGNLVSIILDEPERETYYQVGFLIGGKEIMSREKLYVPLDLRLQPLNPKIPKPYGKNLDIKDTKSQYLVSGDTIDVTHSDFINHTFHGKVDQGTSIQLVWDAPKKQEADKKQEVDYELYYDIWVSDNLEKLQNTNKLEPTQGNLQIRKGNEDNLITRVDDTSDVLGMRTWLKTYIDKQGQVKPMKSNNAYYIKIVAKRAYGNQYTLSQPTYVSINIDKNGNISTPPVMGKPPLRLQENGVAQTSITIEWRTQWYEILTKTLSLYDDDKDEQILAEMGGTKVYTPKILTLTKPLIRYKFQKDWQEHLLLTEDDVKQVRSAITDTAFDQDYYSRKVVLEEDMNYEIKVMPYSEVEGLLAKDQSIENWVATSQKDSIEGWSLITPQEGDQDDRGLVWKEYKVDGLAPNTRYVIMIRAYRTTGEGNKLEQSFPSYIIATTLTDYVGPEPIPTVPQLKLETYTDTSISVSWKYNQDFDYELVYSTKDKPEEAIKWPLTLSNDPADKDYVPNGEKATVTLTGLFPQTTYNIWIKAKQKEGIKESAWSNPVTVKTKALQAPQIPTGLGPAAAQSLEELNLDFKPLGPDYITVEWNKDINDLGEQVEGSIQKNYEYDLEFADNVEFLDSQVVTVKDDLSKAKNYEVLAKNLVKFEKLIANRPYYVRIKARVVFTHQEMGRTISKESEYSTWVRIFTKTSGGEYDGGENDEIVTYPRPIEESYNKGEWTLEIVDAQKVIGEIKTSNSYFYTISMIQYKNRYDAHLRRIKIPVSVMEALSTSRMELRIETELGIYEIPAQAMSFYTQKASAKDIVQLELEALLAYDLRNIAMPFPYSIDKAEKLSVRLLSKTLSKPPLERFDGRIKVALKLDQANLYQIQTFKTYTYDYSYGGWLANQHKMDTRPDATYAVYATASTGIYTLQHVVNYTDYRKTNRAMDQLLASYNIEALGNKYTKDKTVQSDPMINLLIGIANGAVDIDMDADATQNRKKAQAASLYVEAKPGTITQEQALHAVVRLYEMKTGNRVKASSVSLKGVSPIYKEGVQKAYALGLVESLSPNQPVTYGQLANLITLVLP